MSEISRKKLVVAGRVVAALAVHRKAPVPSDVEALREWAGNEEELAMPIDELACAVILRERKQLDERAELSACCRI